ncbi:MAG: hypothetical protein H0U98_02115 [Alphaproteobacteria bacterium]|nr:hypothetical protein [Alphaproteobacteria bacterium]
MLRMSLALFLIATPAFAHHGWGGQEEAVTSLTGTVVQGVSMAGPHATMTIKVANDVWDLTLAPPPRAERAGLKEGLIPVGATVMVRGNRNLDHAKHEMKTIYIKHGAAEYHVYPDRE